MILMQEPQFTVCCTLRRLGGCEDNKQTKEALKMSAFARNFQNVSRRTLVCCQEMAEIPQKFS